MNSRPAKITITSQDIEASRQPPQSGRTGTITILCEPGNGVARTSLTVLAALTLVPFLNVWVWLRQSRVRTGRARRLCLAAAVLLAAVSSAAVFGAGIYAVLPKQDWIAAIDEAADRGVVLVVVKVHERGRQGFSAGTGFVIASDETQALILTNKHVVGMVGSAPSWQESVSRPCELVLRSGAKRQGTVVGWHRQPEVDLALIMTHQTGLAPLAPIGRFQGVKLGEDVLAIGHPEGVFTFSFSRGTVERKCDGEQIQTSVPISRGNSGGPLLDVHGRIIGVNTWVTSPEVGAPHAFSIRADLVLQSDQWIGSPDSRGLLAKVRVE